MKEDDKYIVFIGRWNNFTKKDKDKINILLTKNKNILICVCQEDVIDHETSSAEQIVDNLKKEFPYDIQSGKIKIITIPKVEKVNYEEGYFSSYKMHMISLIKTISWRIIGTADTIIVVWIVSGDPLTGVSIGAVQFVTNLFLYYIHEILWEKCFKDKCECKCIED